MNHIYKVVFNKATNTFVAVAEYARGQGKKANNNNGETAVMSAPAPVNSRPFKPLTVMIVPAMLLMSAPSAFAANPVKIDNAAFKAICWGSVVGNRWETNGNLACGFEADASGKGGAVAVGAKSIARAEKAVAVGGGTTATGDNSVAVGAASSAAEGQSVALGSKVLATGAQATAIGNDTIAEGNAAIAIGSDDLDEYIRLSGTVSTFKEHTGITLTEKAYQETKAKGHASIAIGGQALAESDISVAIGAKSKSKGFGAISVGAGAKAESAEGLDTAFGTGAEATGGQSVAIGLGAKATQSNSIALGTKSTTNAAAAATTSVSIAAANGQKVAFNDFAGAEAKEVIGVVSVGTTNKYRQIQNVAAGRISADSTDAVNGSQLFSVGKTLAQLKQDFDTGGGGSFFVQKDDGTASNAKATIGLTSNATKGIKFTGNGVTVSSDGSGVATVNIAGLPSPSSNITAPSGTSQSKPSDLASKTNNAAIVGDILNTGWNLQVDGTGKQFVKPYDTVNFKGKDGVSVAYEDGAVVIKGTPAASTSASANIEAGNNISVSKTGNATTVKLADQLTFANAIGDASKTIIMQSTNTTADKTKMALSKGGIEFTAPAGTVKSQLGWDGLKFADGNNTAIQDSPRITNETIGFAKTDGTVNADKPHLTATGINAGSTKIAKVAKGTDGTDAVNVSQLAALAKIIKNDNSVGVGSDGAITGISNLGGTTASTVDGAIGAVKTTADAAKTAATAATTAAAGKLASFSVSGNTGMPLTVNNSKAQFSIQGADGITTNVTGQNVQVKLDSATKTKVDNAVQGDTLRTILGAGGSGANVSAPAEGFGGVSGATTVNDAITKVKEIADTAKTASANAVMYDDSNKTTITLGGKPSNGGANPTAVTLDNVASALDNKTSVSDIKGLDNKKAINAKDLATAVSAVDTEISKIKTQAENPLTFQGDDGQNVHRKLGETLKLSGGETENAKLTATTAKNIGVVRNNSSDGLDIRLAKDLTGLTSVTTTNTSGGTSVLNGGGLNVKNTTSNGTEQALYGADGVKFSDGSGATSANTVLITKDKVGFADSNGAVDTTKPHLSVNGINAGGQAVSNIASGLTPTNQAGSASTTLDDIATNTQTPAQGNNNAIASGNAVNAGDLGTLAKATQSAISEATKTLTDSGLKIGADAPASSGVAGSSAATNSVTHKLGETLNIKGKTGGSITTTVARAGNATNVELDLTDAAKTSLKKADAAKTLFGDLISNDGTTNIPVANASGANGNKGGIGGTGKSTIGEAISETLKQAQAVAGNAVTYDDSNKAKITLGGTSGTTIDNLNSGLGGKTSIADIKAIASNAGGSSATPEQKAAAKKAVNAGDLATAVTAVDGKISTALTNGFKVKGQESTAAKTQALGEKILSFEGANGLKATVSQTGNTAGANTVSIGLDPTIALQTNEIQLGSAGKDGNKKDGKLSVKAKNGNDGVVIASTTDAGTQHTKGTITLKGGETEYVQQQQGNKTVTVDQPKANGSASTTNIGVSKNAGDKTLHVSNISGKISGDGTRLTYTDGGETRKVASLDDGLIFTADNDKKGTNEKDKLTRRLASTGVNSNTLNIRGGAAGDATAKDNIKVIADSQGLHVRLAKDIDLGGGTITGLTDNFQQPSTGAGGTAPTLDSIAGSAAGTPSATNTPTTSKAATVGDLGTLAKLAKDGF